jgi:hypothetical protein
MDFNIITINRVNFSSNVSIGYLKSDGTQGDIDNLYITYRTTLPIKNICEMFIPTPMVRSDIKYIVSSLEGGKSDKQLNENQFFITGIVIKPTLNQIEIVYSFDGETGYSVDHKFGSFSRITNKLNPKSIN